MKSLVSNRSLAFRRLTLAAIPVLAVLLVPAEAL